MSNEFSLKDRLKELREKKGITRHKLSKDLNISHNCIRSWEAGEYAPSLGWAKAFAEYFDVSIDYLVGRTNNPKVNDPIESDEDA